MANVLIEKMNLITKKILFLSHNRRFRVHYFQLRLSIRKFLARAKSGPEKIAKLTFYEIWRLTRFV